MAVVVARAAGQQLSRIIGRSGCRRWSSLSHQVEAVPCDYLPVPNQGRVPITSQLEFQGGDSHFDDIAPAFRVLAGPGELMPGAREHLLPPPELQLQMYHCMVTVQAMDVIFYEAQRHGSFSFYMTCSGEEASIVSSAAALQMDDVMFTQYREHGAFLWRGYSLQRMADQCMGNERDTSLGRQMPIHYGAPEHNIVTVSSTVGTQAINAVGAAYTFKMRGEQRAAATYFGDGGSSTGDVHAAFNFAATLRCPVVFLVRNNGFAISTPTSEQFAGPGVAERAASYGIRSVRVDGGDALAVFAATHAARRQAVHDCCPVLVEMMTYRVGHHSTSDDSSRYREADEMALWRSRDPAERLRSHLEAEGHWDAPLEASLRAEKRQECMTALKHAAATPRHPAERAMFDHVYETMPAALAAQQQQLLQHLRRHPDERPARVPHPGDC